MIDVNGIIANASNIRGGENPSYTVEDFLTFSPQFGAKKIIVIDQGSGENPIYQAIISQGDASTTFYPEIIKQDAISDTLDLNPLISTYIIQMFIDLANASVKQSRWRGAWKIGMGLFVSHFCTLWLKGSAEPGSPAGVVVSTGEAKGLVSSKSVGDVSVSYDYNSVSQDLDGWASWKMTIYGQQLATMAKMYGKGGMMVW